MTAWTTRNGKITSKNISPSIVNDPKTSQLSNDNLLIYMLLVAISNEWGVLQDAPAKLHEATGERAQNMDDTINLLVQAELLKPMKTPKGQNVLVIPNYAKWNPPMMQPVETMDTRKFKPRTRNGATPHALTETAEPSVPGFMDFYKIYPRKADRRAAERAWNSAIKRGDKPQQIIDALKQQLPEMKQKERKYIKHPATWLNSGSYMNEPDTPETKPKSFWDKVASGT